MYSKVGGPPSWWKQAQVLVDGVDVTNDCFEADEEGGWAKVYETVPVPGKPGVKRMVLSPDTNIPVRKELRGVVTIRRKEQ